MANVTGCFLIGCLLGSGRADANEASRLGIGIGFIGALTTFSTFGAETIQHANEGQWLLAISNVFANLVLGFAAVLVGIAAGKKLFG